MDLDQSYRKLCLPVSSQVQAAGWNPLGGSQSSQTAAQMLTHIDRVPGCLVIEIVVPALHLHTRYFPPLRFALAGFLNGVYYKILSAKFSSWFEPSCAPDKQVKMFSIKFWFYPDMQLKVRNILTLWSVCIMQPWRKNVRLSEWMRMCFTNEPDCSFNL